MASLPGPSQDTCQAVCLHSFSPNQIIWASGSSSGRFPCCSAPLQMDKTSRLNTNYVPVTHGWVFLARGGIFLSERMKSKRQTPAVSKVPSVFWATTFQEDSSRKPRPRLLQETPGMSQLQSPGACALLRWVRLPLWALSSYVLGQGQPEPAHQSQGTFWTPSALRTATSPQRHRLIIIIILLHSRSGAAEYWLCALGKWTDF